MTMVRFRQMAGNIDQHMQQLYTLGVAEPHQIIDRMMGHTPELHEIWTSTTDKELAALTHEYPGFLPLRPSYGERIRAGKSEVTPGL